MVAIFCHLVHAVAVPFIHLLTLKEATVCHQWRFLLWSKCRCPWIQSVWHIQDGPKIAFVK